MDKKNLITLLFCILPILISYAAEYYYYDGNKIPLTVDKEHLVAITPIGQVVKLPVGVRADELRKIQDSRSNITIYKVADNVAYSKLNLPHIYECYEGLDDEPMIPDGYIYVKINNSTDEKALFSTTEEYGLEFISQDLHMPLWYTFHVLPEKHQCSIEVANQLYETGLFAASEPGFSSPVFEISYDPQVTQQWNLYNPFYEDVDIKISEAWSYATGRGIKVAVIDQGIDLDHIDLKENIANISYDTETRKEASQLYGWHGTHCAGIIGAMRNNGVQITGVAPDVSLISVSISFDSSESVKKLSDGINWAWKNGADIISCSWASGKSNYIKDAIKNAATKGRDGKGCVIVKSAGNEGKRNGQITYPGTLEEVITVASIEMDGIRRDDSSYGSSLFISAPGSNILSTLPNNITGRFSGTSMACPHVSGVAALILERNPSLTTLQVREILAKSASKIGDIPYDELNTYGLWNKYYGYGLVDAIMSLLITPRK